MEDKDFKFDFEKLIVYQKALDFMLEIFKLYKKLPPEYKYTIGSNMVRAGASISNNIAEGSGKKSKKKKAVIIQFLSIQHVSVSPYLIFC